MNVSTLVKKAHELATNVRENAYAPYSKFKVGSAIKFKEHDEIFVGCNVENISFGATICAERNAILNSVAKLKKQEIEFVVVVSENDPPVTPCGMCLQVIKEFASDDIDIYVGNSKEVTRVIKLNELLPNPFTSFTPGE
jgi:homotetrameric cytidine deaminase